MVLEYLVVLLPELHADLFSRHASPLEGYVFVSVDETGEDVMSDEICRRNNGKQQRRRGGRSAQLRDWVTNTIKRQHIVAALTWVTKMKLLSQREPLNVVDQHYPPPTNISV